MKVGLPLGGTFGSAALGPIGTGAGGEGALLLIAVGFAFVFGRSSLSLDLDLALITELGDTCGVGPRGDRERPLGVTGGLPSGDLSLIC